MTEGQQVVCYYNLTCFKVCLLFKVKQKLLTLANNDTEKGPSAVTNQVQRRQQVSSMALALLSDELINKNK